MALSISHKHHTRLQLQARRNCLIGYLGVDGFLIACDKVYKVKDIANVANVARPITRSMATICHNQDIDKQTQLDQIHWFFKPRNQMTIAHKHATNPKWAMQYNEVKDTNPLIGSQCFVNLWLIYFVIKVYSHIVFSP
jgi:hypothetical protein